MNSYEFFSLDHSFSLAHSLAAGFEEQLHILELNRFADGELQVVVPENLALADTTAVLVHPTGAPVHDNLMKLFLAAQSLKKKGVQRVVAVVPYLVYARQVGDGAAGLVVKLIQAAGVDAVVAVEPHDKKLADLFSVPFYAVDLHATIAQHIQENITNAAGCCIVAPDHGACERAQKIADLLGLPVVTFEKERYDVNKVRVVGKDGECLGDCAIMIDDIIDTGGTAFSACEQLRVAGVKTIYGYFVHPVLSGDAVERLKDGLFEKIFVSGSLPVTAQQHAVVQEFAIADALVDVVKKVL